MVNNIIIYSICLLITLGGSAFASPMRPPFDHMVCSANTKYCAFISSKDGIKVFKIEGGDKILEPSYVIHGYYFGAAYLSDDGKKYVVIQNVIDPDHVKTEPAVQVWSSGKFVRKLHMTDLLSKGKAQKTSDGYVWSKNEGFEPDGRFVIELINGKKYEIKD